MTQFFDVQMNLQDAPKFQNEQSSVSSSINADSTETTSFKSVLKEVLPEENNSTPQSNSEGIDPPPQQKIVTAPTVHDEEGSPITEFSNPKDERPNLAPQSQQVDTNTPNSLLTTTVTQALQEPAKIKDSKLLDALNSQAAQPSASGQDENVSDSNNLSAQQNSRSLDDIISDLIKDKSRQQTTGSQDNIVSELLSNKSLQQPATSQGATISDLLNSHSPQSSAGGQDTNNPDLFTNRALHQSDSSQDTIVSNLLSKQLPQQAENRQGTNVHDFLDNKFNQQPTTSPKTAPSVLPPLHSDRLADPSSNTISSVLNNELTGDSQNPKTSPQDALSFGAGTKSLSDLKGLAYQNSNIPGKDLLPEQPTMPVPQNAHQTLTPQLESLINRLQTLINNGAETGSVSIQKVNSVDNELSLRSQLNQIQELTRTDESKQQNIATVVTRGSGSFTVLEDGVFAPTLRSKQQEMTGLRQDSNHQFYSAKVQPQSVLSENSNSTSNNQGDGLNQQNSGFNQIAGSTNSSEPGTPFSLQTGTSLDPLATQPIPDGKTTTLPSGTLIHDQDVIQQLVDRFQVNRRQIESKIQMKLHPVELGKMEIDLTVKEGSIRANVVAQSQHVQEILERNINKLRSVLEQQGFSIEEITVTSESEMVGEFELFDQQFSNSDSYSQNNNKTSEEQNSFVIDDFQTGFLDADSGVNVKA